MCFLVRCLPEGQDGPDDAVVALAHEELEDTLLPRVAAAWAPASRARKLGSAARDEGAEPQDLFVRRYAMGLPAAGRAYARDEISDRTDVFGIGIFYLIQFLFERPNIS